VAVYIVKELCRGLYYAHTFPTSSWSTGDVFAAEHPHLVTGEVKLTDFGSPRRR